MHEGVLGILWLMLISVGIVVAIIYSRKYTNMERLSMIEKGLNPGDMTVKNKPIWPLRFALLFIGAGLGLFVGYFLDMALDMDEVAYFSMFFIFSGAGLGVSYMVEEKKERESN